MCGAFRICATKVVEVIVFTWENLNSNIEYTMIIGCRCFSYSVFHNSGRLRHSDVVHGTGRWTVHRSRADWCHWAAVSTI